MKKKIHPSYDKKTLLEIVKQLGLNINVCKTRHQICNDIIKNYIETYNLYYLYDKNPEPKLTIIKRKEIVYIAKQVSAYCMSYNKDDVFDTYDTFIKHVEYLLPYGDTPSVRKAIQRVNEYFRLNYKTHVSPHTQSILDRQKIIKEHIHPIGLKIKYGKFRITFD